MGEFGGCGVVGHGGVITLSSAKGEVPSGSNIVMNACRRRQQRRCWTSTTRKPVYTWNTFLGACRRAGPQSITLICVRPTGDIISVFLLHPPSFRIAKKSCTHSVTRWTNYTRRFEGQLALPVCSSTTQCFNNVYITPQCPLTATMYLHQLQVWACLLVRSKLRSPLIV